MIVSRSGSKYFPPNIPHPAPPFFLRSSQKTHLDCPQCRVKLSDMRDSIASVESGGKSSSCNRAAPRVARATVRVIDVPLPLPLLYSLSFARTCPTSPSPSPSSAMDTISHKHHRRRAQPAAQVPAPFHVRQIRSAEVGLNQSHSEQHKAAADGDPHQPKAAADWGAVVA